MKKFTIIMPFLNEGDEPINTIKSIYETANKDDFEIIVIDDGSTDNQNPKRFDNYKEVIYIKNRERKGTGFSINMGVNMAKGKNIFIIDAHMRFLDDSWLDKMYNKLEEDDKLLLCSISIYIDKNKKDEWDKNVKLKKLPGHHYGADLLPYFSSSQGLKLLLDPRWIDFKPDGGELYDIPCVMGANYAASKKWMKYIKSTKGLEMWGSIEEFLSLKTWLAGGSVKLLTTTGVGHIYGTNTNGVLYENKYDYVLFNKLWVIYTLLDDKTIYKLFKFIKGDSIYDIPMQMLNFKILEAKKDKEYYSSIFTRDVSFLKTLGVFFNDKLSIKIIEYKDKLDKIDYDISNTSDIINTYKKQLIDLNNSKNISERKILSIQKKLKELYIPDNIKKLEKLKKDKIELKSKIDLLIPGRSSFGYV